MSQYVCDGLVKKVQNSGMELQQVSNESHGTTHNIEEARGQRHGTGTSIVEVETIITNLKYTDPLTLTFGGVLGLALLNIQYALVINASFTFVAQMMFIS